MRKITFGALFMAVALAVSSPVLAAMTLEELEDLKSQVTQENVSSDPKKFKKIWMQLETERKSLLEELKKLITEEKNMREKQSKAENKITKDKLKENADQQSYIKTQMVEITRLKMNLERVLKEIDKSVLNNIKKSMEKNIKKNKESDMILTDKDST